MTKVGENPPRLPKRFYKAATVEIDGAAFVIRLDGKTAKTRAGKPLGAKSGALADAVAAEWNAQAQHVNLAQMPMTRFAMTARDLESDAAIWREAALAFLKSDLLCYRAEEPAELAELQRAAWDPILDWCAFVLNIRLRTGAGVGFVDQPEAAHFAARKAVAATSTEQALALKAAAEISGSAVIALALLNRAFPADQLFAASRIDEAFQAERWGLDSEAEIRERRLKQDFLAVAQFLSLL